jgi:hypothetical protein
VQIYWLAPMAGGALAGVMRKYVFDPDRRKSKNVDCTSGSTQNGKFYSNILESHNNPWTIDVKTVVFRCRSIP